MVELPDSKFGTLLSRLEQVPFNHLFARAVLEGHAAGRVWVDDPARPGFAHILTRYGMSLAWGDGGPEAPGWQILGRHLRDGHYRNKDEWLQVQLGSDAFQFDDLIACETPPPGTQPGGDSCQRYVRLNFRFERGRHNGMSNLMVEPGLRLRPMTSDEFALPDVTVSPHLFWANFEQCQAAGGGWCVESSGAVCALAFTAFRSGRRLELGIETRAAYRRRGYAHLAAQALINDCLAEDLEPIWSCHGDNTGSVATARRLGFVDTHRLPYYRLPRVAENGSAIASNKN